VRRGDPAVLRGDSWCGYHVSAQGLPAGRQADQSRADNSVWGQNKFENY